MFSPVAEHPTPGTPGSPATPGSDSSDENTFPMFRQRLVGKTTDRNSLEWESLFPAVENNIKEGQFFIYFVEVLGSSLVFQAMFMGYFSCLCFLPVLFSAGG